MTEQHSRATIPCSIENLKTPGEGREDVKKMKQSLAKAQSRKGCKV
jgi:hypothetical protein